MPRQKIADTHHAPATAPGRKHLSSAALGVAGLCLAAFGAWVLALPSAVTAFNAPGIPQAEARATLAALAPPKRKRPAIAIVGINDATEATDYLTPYGILARADVGDVMLVATQPGPVRLYPALTVEPHTTIARFDAQYAAGADYVIVPAMSRDDDPVALAWISRQAKLGATVIGICAGAKVLGAAGLLDGKPATTHWYFLDDLRRRSPGMVYTPDRRFVVAPGLVTTTGISASVPTMLTLVEAIAGRERAVQVAQALGLREWDARHDSSAFALTRAFATTVLANTLAFWNRERLGLELREGVDEVSLVLTADAWSRTYRSRVVTFAGTRRPMRTRNGVAVVPDEVAPEPPVLPALAVGDAPPAQVLDNALRAIEARFGRRTADVVAMQLEYPRPVVEDRSAALERHSAAHPR